MERGLAQIKSQAVEADKYINKEEQITYNALHFMSEPGLFWNLPDISVKKRVQDTVFPEGVTYDFNTGFGIVELAESYQLLEQITEVIKRSRTNRLLIW